MSTLIRLRTAEKAYEEICQLDPDTSITRNYIYSLIKSGILPVKKVGRKSLVDMDKLIEYLCNQTSKK